MNDASLVRDPTLWGSSGASTADGCIVSLGLSQRDDPLVPRRPGRWFASSWRVAAAPRWVRRRPAAGSSGGRLLIHYRWGRRDPRRRHAVMPLRASIRSPDGHPAQDQRSAAPGVAPDARSRLPAGPCSGNVATLCRRAQIPRRGGPRRDTRHRRNRLRGAAESRLRAPGATPRPLLAAGATSRPIRPAPSVVARPRVRAEDPDHRRLAAELVDRRGAGRLLDPGIEVGPEDVLPGALARRS